MSLQFKREHRYFVFKVKNITQEQQQRLYDFEMELGPRNSVGECVVVESDWPNYQDTWDAIQAVTEKRYISRGHLQADCAEWRERAIKAEAEHDALAAQLEALRSAIEPFATGGVCSAIDREDYSIMRERIKDWHGVIEFKKAQDAYNSTPQQCLRDVRADAIEKAVEALSVTIFDKKAFYEYAATVRQGGAA